MLKDLLKKFKIEENLLIEYIFFKFLAIIYLIAFVSLWTQILGLIGSEGVLPASQFLQAAKTEYGDNSFWFVPTLYWLNSSDLFLVILCIFGVNFSILLFFNIFRSLMLFFLWFIYLSFVVVGQDFLSFQWDILLLETTFLSMFLSLAKSFSSSRLYMVFLWLLRLLLFKLMFLSGAVKLMSNDLAWRDLTALTYHYETQPLPNFISYFFHFLPLLFHKISCVIMFLIELFVPFLIFANRKFRICAAYIFIFLQFLIALTGNYCFFNLLTVLLCVLLLDDKVFPGFIKNKFSSKSSIVNTEVKAINWTLIVFASLILVLNVMQFSRVYRLSIAWPSELQKLYSFVLPFRTINTYGLFAIMTTTRNEISIEGSNDKVSWIEYNFKYKPDDLNEMPKIVAPHQPRLDWQMWFAALSNFRNNPWFVNLCYRLLVGSKDVLNLLDKNAFSDNPPKYIRATFYEYKFSKRSSQNEKNWWKREYRGLYFPVVTLKNNSLILAE